VFISDPEKEGVAPPESLPGDSARRIAPSPLRPGAPRSLPALVVGKLHPRAWQSAPGEAAVTGKRGLGTKRVGQARGAAAGPPRSRALARLPLRQLAEPWRVPGEGSQPGPPSVGLAGVGIAAEERD